MAELKVSIKLRTSSPNTTIFSKDVRILNAAVVKALKGLRYKFNPSLKLVVNTLGVATLVVTIKNIDEWKKLLDFLKRLKQYQLRFAFGEQIRIDGDLFDITQAELVVPHELGEH